MKRSVLGPLVASVAVLGLALTGVAVAAPPNIAAVPRAHCGPRSHPELGLQGRVSARDVADGYAEQGYTCNTELVGHFGTTGGYRNYRYVDAAGHVCAFYDTTLLFPTNALQGSTHTTGVFVLDMSNPARPVHTATLSTPAMQSPHESLSLNVKRGLLAADLGNPLAYPGYVDVYDVSKDCRHPVLDSSLPVGVLGHEGTFSPDGRTFWVSSAGGGTLTAVDVTVPQAPKILWTERGIDPHGLNVSDDGNTLYIADLGNNGTTPGLTVLDVSQIQRRVSAPQVRQISHITWPSVSIPQVPLPVTIGGHRYLVEIDEFATDGGNGGGPATDPNAQVGAARIIDIADPAHPHVISNIRLEVNQPANRAAILGDPGANNSLQGYAGHYCAVPQRNDPGIVACSFILSGLRIFDIRDPYHPREIAYFNAPVHPSSTGGPGSNYAMSAPAFDPAHSQIWYSDGNDGFYAVRVVNGVWPF
ncbi:MAG TPA: hypothetical protein VFA11_03775 [Acidimicrobiales bacterium]|nr:hypothetical protein [Acidimicrobiales bacterium]